MNNFRRLVMALLLTLTIGVPVLADCSVDPGILSTPPCAGAQLIPNDPETSDESIASGQTNSPLSFAENESLFSDVAVDIVQFWLTAF